MRLVPFLLLGACAGRPLPADLLVYGELDAAPTAVVVRGERIEAVVSPSQAQRYQGPETRTLEAQRVTAGFVDAHGHPGWLGQVMEQVDLVGASSYAEALARLEAAPADGPLLGHGWDQNDWPDVPEGGWPLAADLQARFGDRFVLLTRIDGHAVWASPSALNRVPDEDPEGGQVVRDAEGRPSGVLVDAAVDLVAVPEPDDATRERQLRTALGALAARGLTGVHAMSVDDAELAVYERLDAAGALPVRVWVYVAADTAAAERLLAEGPRRGDRLAVVGIKSFVDGALGSRGAWLRAPYADAPDTVGLPQADADAIGSLTARALGAGVQVAVHAIGDAGVGAALDGFAQARSAVPDAPTRLRIEHAQVLGPEDAPRFAALGVVASMQPTHATSDMPWAEDRLGPERVARAYAWRTLRDAGAVLAFGSDFPVERPDPSDGLWAATRRADAAGLPEGGWTPEQRLTEAEAIAAFTEGAAWAVHEEDRLGRVAPGQLADLTLWAVLPDGRWEPVAIVVGGKERW